MEPEFVPVDSSMIKNLLYNHDDSSLLVEFKNNSRYIYQDVTKQMFKEMIESESVGKYFHANIKKLPNERIN
ncbi:MAG: KTSC domain-containing protein [Methanogenium sp.]